MGILDILAKLGILRMGGTAATYKNAKDRPAELMMDGVFDSRRDMVGGKAAKAAVPPAKGAQDKTGQGKDPV